LEDEKISNGGSYDDAAKKEYGAIFTLPVSDIVETKAIGLGTTTPVKILLNPSNVFGSIITIFSYI